MTETFEARRYGVRLREAIEARHVPKLYLLAAELRVSESALSRWLRSEPIKVDHFAKLCIELDVSADWLMLGRGHMEFHLRSGDKLRVPELADALKRLRVEDMRRLSRFLVGLSEDVRR